MVNFGWRWQLIGECCWFQEFNKLSNEIHFSYDLTGSNFHSYPASLWRNLSWSWEWLLVRLVWHACTFVVRITVEWTAVDDTEKWRWFAKRKFASGGMMVGKNAITDLAFDDDIAWWTSDDEIRDDAEFMCWWCNVFSSGTECVREVATNYECVGTNPLQIN